MFQLVKSSVYLFRFISANLSPDLIFFISAQTNCGVLDAAYLPLLRAAMGAPPGHVLLADGDREGDENVLRHDVALFHERVLAVLDLCFQKYRGLSFSENNPPSFNS